MGCKGSRVQISASRPTSFVSYRRNRNPYSPPAARVSDPVVSSVPRVVRWTVWINVAILIFNPIIGAFDGTLMPTVSAESRSAYQWGLIAGIVIAAAGNVLFAVLLHRIYHRRNWARMVFALLTAAGLFAYTPYVLNEFPAHPITGSLSALSSMMSLATLVLVFTPAANRWFRDRGASAS